MYHGSVSRRCRRWCCFMVSVVVDDAGLTAVVDIFVRDVAVVVDISIFVLVVDDFVPGGLLLLMMLLLFGSMFFLPRLFKLLLMLLLFALLLMMLFFVKYSAGISVNGASCVRFLLFFYFSLFLVRPRLPPPSLHLFSFLSISLGSKDDSSEIQPKRLRWVGFWVYSFLTVVIDPIFSGANNRF